MAEIFTLPGVELPKPDEAKPSDIAEYCRKVADLIDNGTVVAESAVVVLSTGPYINVQRIGTGPVGAAGLLAFAQRVVTG